MAKGDVTRIEAVTDLNINTCLLALCYEKDKTELENNQIKKQFKK